MLEILEELSNFKRQKNEKKKIIALKNGSFFNVMMQLKWQSSRR
jgi:hypothetical protein